ncbi:hypothetical protein JCM19296_2056 [Nonlabens ulvanivorans]|nr:hypothetical protein JCM19296_2056 [Nonlabens ulvanivorans]
MPEQELVELAKIYEERGLNPATAIEVAKQLTAHDALGTHARDELGISEQTEAKPLQAALSSGIAFTVGGFLPVVVAYMSPLDLMEYVQYVFAIVFLILLGVVAARAGGSSVLKAIFRVTLWGGTLAMGITALIGNLFEVNL